MECAPGLWVRGERAPNIEAGIGKWYSTTRPQGMIVPGVGCDWIVSEHAAFKESCRSVKRFVSLHRAIRFKVWSSTKAFRFDS